MRTTGGCRAASANFVTECLSKNVARSGSRICGNRSDTWHLNTDFADEPLHRLPAPHPYSLLQGIELSQAVSAGVADLELDEQSHCGLIRMFRETPCHLLPMVLEDIGSATPWFVSEVTIRLGPFAATAESTMASFANLGRAQS